MTTYYAPLTDTIYDAHPNDSNVWVVPLDPSEYVGPNSSFIGNFQFAIDATSANLFRACPRKYQLALLEGWHEKAQRPPLRWGIAFHTCMEVWHKLLVLSPHPLIPHDLRSNGYKYRMMLPVTKLAGLLGETLPPGDNLRTKETLVRSVVWYIDQFFDDPAETVILEDGTAAVEHSFSIPLMEIDYEGKKTQVYYCGHMDRLLSFSGSIYTSDYKSTGYQLNDEFFQAFKPSGQMSGYNIAARVLRPDEDVDGIMIDGIELGVTYTRFQRSFISYTPEEIEEDIQDLRAVVREMRDCAEEGYWPKNPTACGRFFKTQEREIIDTGCHFRNICSKPPHLRPLYLKANFVQRTWDPLRSR